jgi:long-subunit acyl-CoA synthetase (AMP-forming)
MMHLGLEAGQGVVVLGFNRPEWFVADLAAIAAGGVPAGIYTTCTLEQCRHIANDCRAAVAVVENSEYLDRFLSLRSELGSLRAIVLMEGEPSHPDVYSWKQLLDLAERTPSEALRERMDGQNPDDLCTLIYTSGTTGPAKGVMLSHRNITWIAEQLRDTYAMTENHCILSYLPLSHIAEQVVSLHTPISCGGCTWFAESLEKLGTNLREVRPQFFFAVPRVWEKIQARMEAAGAQSGGLKRRIAAWARGQGLAGGYADQQGRRRPLFYGLADRLVFSKVRRDLGLDRALVCATSAAPISFHTLEFFLSLGIPILEVYGMSECTGPATFSTPDRYRTGSAGFAIRGTEIKLADDGEIWMRGPHVFLGYANDRAGTEEALDADGWLHSGDIGELDEDGFLRITDRKKELIITSGGKNVAPQLVEGKLRSIAVVSAAAVIGDRKNYLTALITLDPERIEAEAERLGSPARDTATAAGCPRFQSHLDDQVAKINKTLASFETVKRFSVLPGQFSTEGGELTPTMKLKRRVIAEKYAAQIDALYA